MLPPPLSTVTVPVRPVFRIVSHRSNKAFKVDGTSYADILSRVVKPLQEAANDNPGSGTP